MRRAVGSALAEFGGLDVLINCAGIVIPTELGEVDDLNWRAHIDVNLSGSFYMAREATPHLSAGDGGTIVNVGSELSTIGLGS